MKRVIIVIVFICFFSIIYSNLYAEEGVYVRVGNKIVLQALTAEDLKKMAELRKNLNLMDANLIRKLEEPEEVVVIQTVSDVNQHVADSDIHHMRYIDAEAINAVQEALDLTFKSVSQINVEGGDIRYFEYTPEEANNATIIIYGKGDEEERYGKIRVDDISGDFSITNSAGEEISIDASRDLNLNSNAYGDLVLFRNTHGLVDRNLFIYGQGESFASLGFITGTNDFQIANSKPEGNLLLVTKNGNVYTEGNLMTTGDLFANAKGYNKDSYIYFHENGDPKGAFIRYSTENKAFEFSSHLSDIAERVEIDEPVEAGEVIVFGENARFGKSRSANSRNAAGVISTNSAFIIGGKEDGRPLALSGQIEVKVCNQNGEIKVGDFLTTSDVPGHAMKCTEMAPGSILGQALEDFSSDKGTVKMIIKIR